MSAVAAAAGVVLAALEGLDGVRVEQDPGAAITPPSTADGAGGATAVLGPPSLLWESGAPEPTTARFLVYVVVDATDRAIERLWELVPVVAAALDTEPDVVVIQADPGTYPAGGVELPCYQIQIEVSL